ncbi:MAG: stage IV sporulation protein A [Oscillospiraceae bacterium]|nr:stage IV sporulation protein A [Oscillospiraceae bacterium]
MEQKSIYEQIGLRTDGNVYVCVVGPVRTGKSTFIKRFMEELVLPSIDNVYRRERAKDELPQSGSGRTIMTAEPKFVPEEAVEISPDGTAKLSVRLIDSVGYMVPGAIGADEDGQPRMVTTPWYDHEIPMTEAAELGTKKVMEDHGTIGIVMTTDGSITDIPREDYADAEDRAIRDMQATGKPFLVLVNSQEPEGEAARQLCAQLGETYGVRCLTVNCMTLQEGQIKDILKEILYEFPVSELRFFLPSWVEALEAEHPLKQALYDAMRTGAGQITRLGEAEGAIQEIRQLENVEDYHIREIDLGVGVISCVLDFPQGLFYQILGEKSGFSIENDGDLLTLLGQLAETKKRYDKVANALDEVWATGYGVVMPGAEDIHMEVPEIVRKGGSYGVRLKASAPSIHMMRADIKTEISPIVGDEKQSEDLINYLLGEYEGNTEKLWESNIFGKSLFELVNDGLSGKLRKMPDDSRYKFKDALQKIINEGGNGLLCLIL